MRRPGFEGLSRSTTRYEPCGSIPVPEAQASCCTYRGVCNMGGNASNRHPLPWRARSKGKIPDTLNEMHI